MTLQNTKEWFEAAVPEPDDRAKAVQLGCHLEEVVEMLESVEVSNTWLQHNTMSCISRLSEGLKDGSISIRGMLPFGYLDALADQIVTAVGCAHMEGMDIQGALAEVNRSNWSKFVDGKPVFDENGKIKKGPGYSVPELGRFVGDAV